jgi:hypothetical protein
MVREATNKPYVKQFAIVDGVTTCINPIKSHRDEEGKLVRGKYENDGTNRVNRRPDKTRYGNNRKTNPVIINMFPVKDADGKVKMTVSKYTKRKQVIPSNVVLRKMDGITMPIRYAARVIWHYVRLA